MRPDNLPVYFVICRDLHKDDWPGDKWQLLGTDKNPPDKIVKPVNFPPLYGCRPLVIQHHKVKYRRCSVFLISMAHKRQTDAQLRRKADQARRFAKRNL